MQKAYKTFPLNKQSGAALRFLHKTLLGRLLLRLLVCPFISKFAGFLLDRRFSKCLIKGFIKKNNIDMKKYKPEEYSSFNAFFTRDVKDEYKRMPQEGFLASPCDGKLSCYSIDENSAFSIKQSVYTIGSLLDSDSNHGYKGGICLIFRLAPNDFHRYFYIDDGRTLDYRCIAGELNTVRPIAVESRKVFSRNQREYALLDSKQFGSFVQMEVGAMLVGRIRNHKKTGVVAQGEEKGMFEFGGSTIILLFPKGAVEIHPEIIENTKNKLETIVDCGQIIGRRGNAVI